MLARDATRAVVGVGLGDPVRARRVDAGRARRALRRPLWIGLGLLWTLVAIAGWAAAVVNDGGSGAGGLIILGWVGAIATTLSIRPAFNRTSGSGSCASARRRSGGSPSGARPRSSRSRTRRSRSSSASAGPTGRARSRPGWSTSTTRRWRRCGCCRGSTRRRRCGSSRLREELNGFASLHDLGAVLELDGHAVERLRDDTVFLPR